MAYQAVIRAGRRIQMQYDLLLDELARIEAAREKYADRPAVIAEIDALGSATEMATMKTRAQGYRDALKGRVDAMEANEGVEI